MTSEDTYNKLIAYLDENKAEYRNIPYGKYIFELKSKSNTGNWSEIIDWSSTIRTVVGFVCTILAPLLFLLNSSCSICHNVSIMTCHPWHAGQCHQVACPPGTLSV